MSEWINAKDGLPDIGQWVLGIDTLLTQLVVSIEKVSITKRKDSELHSIEWVTIHNENYWQDITHWMPLPEPPKN